MPTIKIIELIGTSTKSWEDAASNAIREAAETVQDITGLEVQNQTARIENGKIVEYRSNVKAAFKVKTER